jgi:Di-haem oxidoreductase, putative peroxidase
MKQTRRQCIRHGHPGDGTFNLSVGGVGRLNGRAFDDLGASARSRKKINRCVRPFSDFMLHDIGTGDGIVQTQDAQRPARGAERFLQQAQQAPEIQWLQQAPPEADRCVVHMVQDLSAQPTSTTAENLEGIKASGARVLDGRTANMIRTAPLWGLRVRPQLLHDGSALTTEEAILRHSVQAKDAKEAFERLSREDKQRLLIFLKSL